MKELGDMAKAGALGRDVAAISCATKDAEIPARIKVRFGRRVLLLLGYYHRCYIA